MSGLRRSRPEEQDATLKRLQEISLSRQEFGSVSSTSTSPVLSFKSFSGQEEDDEEFDDANGISPNVETSEFKEATKFLVPLKSKFDVVLNEPTQFQKEYQSPLLQQKNLSLPLHLTEVSRLVLPPVPKPRTKSENDGQNSTSHKVPLSTIPSPIPASRKYQKMLSSPALLSKRRGSEPILDKLPKQDYDEVQMNVADRRWERLRSILVAMKDEPFDVDESLKSSPPDIMKSLQEKISTQEELHNLQRELLSIQGELMQKNLEIQQTEQEKQSILAYIRQKKLDSEDFEESGLKFYEQGLENLKTSEASKDNVIEILASVMKEFNEQRSYLNCLMTVVLMRAPWMLDEVDKMKLSLDLYAEEDDDEVWC